jgi:hypothetical protein
MATILKTKPIKRERGSRTDDGANSPASDLTTDDGASVDPVTGRDSVSHADPEPLCKLPLRFQADADRIARDFDRRPH